MLHPDLVARIKACQGVYSVGDTARHFRVSKRTVHNVWQGRTHTGVSPASEPDNVITSRVPADVIVEDGRTLLERYNGNYNMAAQDLGVSPNTLRNHMKREAAPSLMVF